MKRLNSIPCEDGYYMPGEFEKHKGTLMIWPERPGSWIYGAKAARKAFTEIATQISECEKMYMLVSEQQYDNAKSMLPAQVELIKMDTDDAWVRDTGPTFVKNTKGQIRGIDWCFNAWGGEYDGLYASWEKDNLVAGKFLEYLDVDIYDASDFVLEGGSIHSDGEGTMLVTESCLLSKGRNPHLTKDEIEDKLKAYCGVKKVIWLPCGIYQDETNEHVDNVCAFSAPGEVLLAWTDDTEDPQYEMSNKCLQTLTNETDAKGRKFVVRKLPIPKVPICITEEELAGFSFEEGEDDREIGERLAASYVNFYIANDKILVPQFGDVHDQVAVDILKEAFPTRKIVPIFARDILVGGGNIHCITQQIPYAK